MSGARKPRTASSLTNYEFLSRLLTYNLDEEYSRDCEVVLEISRVNISGTCPSHHAALVYFRFHRMESTKKFLPRRKEIHVRAK